MQKKRNAFILIRERPGLSITIGAAMFIIGVLISDLPRMIVSPGWPTTEGTIVSRRYVAQRFKEYDDDLYTNIDVYIRYQYEVDGIPFSSSSLNAIDTPYYPYRYGSRYPVGKGVIVYYNPKAPYKAVLEPGIIDFLGAFDVFSYLIFGAGIYFIHIGISRVMETRKRKHGI